jgi:hypothetical protein
MGRELVEDYLKKAGMSANQAEALSRILAEMATKSYVLLLEQKLIAMEQKFEKRLSELESRLTGRIVAIVAFLAAVMTLLEVFVD